MVSLTMAAALELGAPGAVVWLASAQASYITGVVVPVDGGFLAP